MNITPVIHGAYVSFSNLLRFGYRTFFRIGLLSLYIGLLGTKKVSNGCLLEFCMAIFCISKPILIKIWLFIVTIVNVFRRLSILGRIGWWEADFSSRQYLCSEYVCKLLGLEGEYLSFEDFGKMITRRLSDAYQPGVPCHSEYGGL